MARTKEWMVLPTDIREEMEVSDRCTPRLVGLPVATLWRASAGRLVPASAAKLCTEWYARHRADRGAA